MKQVLDVNLNYASGFPLTGETTTVAINSTTSAETTLVFPGRYRIHSTVEAWFCAGPTATVDASSSTGALFPAGAVEYFGTTDPTNVTLSFLATGSSGSVYVTKMKPASEDDK